MFLLQWNREFIIKSKIIISATYIDKRTNHLNDLCGVTKFELNLGNDVFDVEFRLQDIKCQVTILSLDSWIEPDQMSKCS